ncbi:APC family permease [uncultured Sphingomonas sp.]|uniref:APC family permease n=1 Tax=uncultured Sphingomonas sp. TaxID=158754 RepID=UPI0025ED9689|nr:amino acid permease [uncultured Sphingomonas sp.]
MSGTRLLRVLGAAFAVAAVVGGTIGQGILRTPGLVAAAVPDATLILALWLTGGAIAAVDACSTVELGASTGEAGGPFAFVRRTFGPVAGLAAGLADWLGNLGAVAFIAVVFAEYLGRLGIDGGLPIPVLSVLLIAIMFALQWRGTRSAARTQEAGSAIKAVLFLGLIAVLAFARGEPQAEATAPSGVITLAAGIAALRAVYGTYYGWNSAAYFAEELRNPRGLVRGTFVGIALVTAVFVGLNAAMLHVLTPTEMAGSTLVAADAAGRVMGARADTGMTIVSLVSLVTILGVMLMFLPRILFAMGRSFGVERLAGVAAGGTPRAALAATAIGGALLALIGVYETLLAFSAVLLAMVGVAVNLAAIVLRRREPALERPWKMPLFPLPAIFSALVNTALVVAFVVEDPVTSLSAIAAMAVLLAVIVPLLRRRTHG